MPIKMGIQLTEEYMYDFMKYHNDHRASGIVGKVIGYLSIVFTIIDLLVLQISDAVMWLMFAIIFLVYMPWMIRKKAKAQIKNSPMFNKLLEIEFTEEGVVVRQDGQEATNPWDSFVKVVQTKKSVIMYMSRVRAFVFPIEYMGENYDAILEVIRSKVSEKAMKIRKKR